MHWPCILLVIIANFFCRIYGFFESKSNLLNLIPSQKNYGIAVSDVDHDGTFEWIIGGFNAPNMVLKLINATKPHFINLVESEPGFEAIADPKGDALGVAACDIDGDGREEIYFVNSNFAYGGQALYRHSLFKWRDGKYVDLYNDKINADVVQSWEVKTLKKVDNVDQSKSCSIRSLSDWSRLFAYADWPNLIVACIDRFGKGLYGFVVSCYAARGKGTFSLLEMDTSDPRNNVKQGIIKLKNAAIEAGIAEPTGGRAVLVGPFLGSGASQDILFLNEGSGFLENPGSNNFFMNRGDGTFVDVTEDYRIADAEAAPRGAVSGDFDGDGWLDLVYASYQDATRVFVRGQRNSFVPVKDMANLPGPEIANRNIVLADFDNDGDEELYFNNFPDPSLPAPNQLLKIIADEDGNLSVKTLDPGTALEEEGFGTGAGVADMDNDGILELLLSHGEDKAQPLSLYQHSKTLRNHWIRFRPLTIFGAPARGAVVNLTLSDGTYRLKIVDGSPGYLCHDAPFAHFGLGTKSVPRNIKILWPGNAAINQVLFDKDLDKEHIISYPQSTNQRHENFHSEL